MVTYSLFQVQLPPVAVHFGLAAGSLAKTQNPSISVPFSPFVLGDQMLSQGRCWGWKAAEGELLCNGCVFRQTIESVYLWKSKKVMMPQNWNVQTFGNWLSGARKLTSQAPLVVWLSLSQGCICTNMFATIKIYHQSG